MTHNHNKSPRRAHNDGDSRSPVRFRGHEAPVPVPQPGPVSGRAVEALPPQEEPDRPQVAASGPALRPGAQGQRRDRRRLGQPGTAGAAAPDGVHVRPGQDDPAAHLRRALRAQLRRPRGHREGTRRGRSRRHGSRGIHPQRPGLRRDAQAPRQRGRRVRARGGRGQPGQDRDDGQPRRFAPGAHDRGARRTRAGELRLHHADGVDVHPAARRARQRGRRELRHHLRGW